MVCSQLLRHVYILGASVGFNEIHIHIHMFHMESELGNFGTQIRFNNPPLKHNANGLAMESVCPIQSCRAKFEVGVTDIGPMTIVGPENHLRVGKEAWVCVSHIRDSLDVADDDDFCDNSALTHDADVMEKRTGLGAKRMSKKKHSPKAKRSILGFGKKKDMAKGKFPDSMELFGPTDEEPEDDEK